MSSEHETEEGLRFSLRSVIIGGTLLGGLLGLWKFSNPTPPPPPPLPEGWDRRRVIMSQQALDIIRSPTKITAYLFEPSDREYGVKFQLMPQEDKGPRAIDPLIVDDLTTRLIALGEVERDWMKLITLKPGNDLKLVFEQDSSQATVSIDFFLPVLEVFYQGKKVGMLYEDETFLKESEGPEFFDLARKVRSELMSFEHAKAMTADE